MDEIIPEGKGSQIQTILNGVLWKSLKRVNESISYLQGGALGAQSSHIDLLLFSVFTLYRGSLSLSLIYSGSWYLIFKNAFEPLLNWPYMFLLYKISWGTSLVVQWLRLCAPILDLGTKIPHAMGPGQKKKKKNPLESVSFFFVFKNCVELVFWTVV